MKKITQNLTKLSWRSGLLAMAFLFSLTINAQVVGQEYLTNPGVNTTNIDPETGYTASGNFNANGNGNYGGWDAGTGGAYAGSSTGNGQCHSPDRQFKFFKVGGTAGQFVNQTMEALPAGNYNFGYWNRWDATNSASEEILPTWSADGDSTPKFTIKVQDADGAWVNVLTHIPAEPTADDTWTEETGTWTNDETRDVRVQFYKDGGANTAPSNLNNLWYVDTTTFNYASALATTPAVKFIGVIDATVPSAGNNGKALHLLVNEDIADLSAFSLITHSNGNSSDSQTNFPSTGSISAGSHILVARSVVAMESYMNASALFDLVIEHTKPTANGNDAMDILLADTVVDSYGIVGDNPDTTGDGCDLTADPDCWDTEDAWAYKTDGVWAYASVNCTDGSYKTWDSNCVYPLAVNQQATGASTDLVTAFSENMSATPAVGFWYNDGEAPIERVTTNPGQSSDSENPTADDAMKYTDDGAYQYSNMQIQFTSKVDMSSMNTYTVDVYVDGTTTTGTAPVNLALKLQDSSEGTPWTNQNVIIQDITADTWTTLTFAFNDDASMSRDDVDRIVVQFNGEGNTDQVTAYMKNMVGSYTESVADAAPAVAAPTPTQAAEDVMSILSTHYTAGVVINEVNPDWGQQTILTEVELNGDPLWKMSDLNYQGQNLATTDISTMEYVHVDVWSESGEAFNFFLLDAGSPEVSQAITPTAGGAWHSVDIPLADYDAVRELVRTNLVQLKWDGTVSLMYIGNLYFWKNPTAAGDTCDHTFVMNDSYGDSWNGSSVDILVNGVVVVEGAAAVAGSGGATTENLVFQAATGDVISLGNWVTGTYTSEVSWEILDNEGTSLASGNHGADASVDGYCTPPAECDHTFVMNDSYGDSWNGSSVDILVDGVVVVEGAAAVAGSGGATTENLLFNAVEGSSITLANWVTGTYTSEVSWVILDGTGEELASGNHGDVADVTANCTLPDCLTPTDLTVSDITTTGALLSWVSEGSQFMIEIQPAGSPQGTEGGYTVGDIDPYPLTYVDLNGFLTENTAYDIYVINVCDSSNSAWAGPASFTTLALPIVPDYTNDFTEFPGDLWSSGSPTGSFASAWTADGFANDGATGAAKSNIYSSNSVQVLESPVFDLSAGSYFLNLKAAVTAWNTTDALAMGSDDSVTVSVSVDGGDYVVLHTWNESNNPGPTGTDMPTVDLTSYSSANVKFAITVSDGTVNDAEDYDFFVDDFSITAPFVSPTWAGDWQLDPTAGSLAVGPNAGDLSWWSSNADTPAERACLFDDIYRFGADGTFENVLGDQTWLEGWQEGQEGEGCGAPIAPHDGSNAASYTYTGTSVTVSGSGAFLGLAKVHNAGEDGAPAGDTITYEVISVDETYMTVHINFGGGVWAFRFINSTALGIDDVNPVSSFNFFPNPVNDVLTIKAQASIDSITVYNMLGQAVVRSTPNTTDSTVDMSALQTGAYFVQVSINNTVKTVRVIKN